MARDPLACYADLRRDYGDVVRIPFTPRRTFYLLGRPEHAEHVLVAHQDRYAKAFTYRALKTFIGDGLLTSEGDTWRRHRRLVQPVFSRRHVQAFAPTMVASATARAATWARRESIDIATEMRTLTMDVVGRVLFGTDLASGAERIGGSVTRLQESALVATLFPTRARSLVPGLAAASDTLDDLVGTVVERRIANPHDTPSDLLDLLLASTGDGPPLTAREVRDEVSTLVLAGHETTASTLAWTFALLSRFPAARERLHAEVDEVLAGRDPRAGDVDRLGWTNAVISEAMRLYPPAWTIERDAVEADVITGVDIPAGSTVVVSPYLLHRDPEFWPNPEGFDPARFLPGHTGDRPRCSYLPFGGGRRICVGASFAQLEAALILATVASRYRLDLAPGARVRARAGVTLHPRGAIPMTVTARAG
ncbi:cytochrome P450 [Pseudonocardia acaciae]|uniref:cytochrome P450 n=1 Tax=Pseudonocardia acaciae TaxID=551276 RepID=UPI00068875CA